MKICVTASSVWRTVFEVPQKEARIKHIEQELEDPGIWEDHEKASSLSKELADSKEDVQGLKSMKTDLRDLQELEGLATLEDDLEAQAVVLEQAIAKAERQTFLSGPHDKKGATLTITAGAGGKDAQDWAAMLFRMYERYCEKKGWRAIRIHESYGESGAEGRAGIKQAVLDIEGSFVYGLLKKETGVHRLVRISPFSSQSLRHTSFASVDVIPRLKAQEEKEIEIRPEDLRIEFTRSSGPGGQNVNKRETAVRITHIPTGLVAESQHSRTQQQNREKALDVIVSKLTQMRELEKQKELAQIKGKQSAIEWGSQIRSYVLHPYKMVKDHRTGTETSQPEHVLEGNLDEFIETAPTHD
ncbi:MAG: peptide chain release factor 2 [bacterium]|nr:peptide chain release factor 2 [bacterium]